MADTCLLFFEIGIDAVGVDVEACVLEHILEEFPELVGNLETGEGTEKGVGGDAIEGFRPVKEYEAKAVTAVFALVKDAAEEVQSISGTSAGAKPELCVGKERVNDLFEAYM